MTQTQSHSASLSELFGRIGDRRELSERDKLLAAIIALTYTGSQDLIQVFSRTALESGALTTDEFQEVMLAGAIYLGFPPIGTVLRPAVVAAVRELDIPFGDPLLLEDPAGRHDRAVGIWETVHAVPLRPMDDLLMSAAVDFVCGEVYSRPGLSLRDRRLIAITILTSQGLLHALTVHVRSALANGEWQSDELTEVGLWLSSFIGLPKADLLLRVLLDAGLAPTHD
jgi:4-carboxymuconolactone decarboxylase